MFGIHSAPPPGTAAVRALCEGWEGFTAEEKQAVAELLVKLVPSLAAEGGRADALPKAKIAHALGAAFRAAWVGILKPRKLMEQIATALESDPAAAELRAFCLGVAERCRAPAPPALRLVPGQGPPVPLAPEEPCPT
jgi:hypothetical protein